MAKYTLKFSCGHCEEKQLYGKESERGRYMAWAAERGTCTACLKADHAAAVDAIENEHSLPTLEGSEKQVAWARKIRAGKIDEAVKVFNSYADKAAAAGTLDELENRSAFVMQNLYGKTTARWWIENKDQGALNLIEAAWKARK